MCQIEKETEKKIEELVEREIESREVKVDTEDIKQKIIEELSNSQKQEYDSLGKLKSISRREFIKTLGLGAGGLALSSQVAGAWSLWQPQNKGKSDINADKVDGNDASQLGGVSPGSMSNVTSSRSADTVYQNTNGSAVRINIVLTNVNALDPMVVRFYTGSSNAPSNLAYKSRSIVDNGRDDHEQLVADFSVIVPDGYYYELRPNYSGNAGVELVYWGERTL